MPSRAALFTVGLLWLVEIKNQCWKHQNQWAYSQLAKRPWSEDLQCSSALMLKPPLVDILFPAHVPPIISRHKAVIAVRDEVGRDS